MVRAHNNMGGQLSSRERSPHLLRAQRVRRGDGADLRYARAARPCDAATWPGFASFLEWRGYFVSIQRRIGEAM